MYVSNLRQNRKQLLSDLIKESNLVYFNRDVRNSR